MKLCKDYKTVKVKNLNIYLNKLLLNKILFKDYDFALEIKKSAVPLIIHFNKNISI